MRDWREREDFAAEQSAGVVMGCDRDTRRLCGRWIRVCNRCGTDARLRKGGKLGRRRCFRVYARFTDRVSVGVEAIGD